MPGRPVVRTSDRQRDRGAYARELDPPVPVFVTKGKIRSRRETPPKASAPARP
jgi:hypothetical protein